jgi:hypothetical protein
MWDMVKEGKKDKEIAKALGVSERAIRGARKKLNLSIVKQTTLETAHEIVRRELDVVDQLSQINKRSNEILDDLVLWIQGKETKTVKPEGKDARSMALDTIKEIRMQLSFQVEIMKVLADYRVSQDFQKEVLEVISSASKCPDCGEPIICNKCEKKIDLGVTIFHRLKALKALRASVEITK